MADDAQDQSADETTAVSGEGAGTETTIVAATIADDQGVLAEAAIAVEGDHALVVARFADADAARTIYDDLRASEKDGAIHIDGVLVVNAKEDGKLHVQKMTDHSTRTGLKWGIVGGVLAGIFLPATIIGGAVALGVAGAAAGKARNLSHRLDVENELKSVITPGTSGILALVTAADAPAAEEKMAGADEVKTVPVSEDAAAVIKEAAVEADATPAADASTSTEA